MLLSDLQLVNFRNYTNQAFQFNGKYNLICGSNGQGKTNLLEAIYFCTSLRSFRTNNFHTLITQGKFAFSIKASYLEQDAIHDLSITYGNDFKEITFDNKTLESKKKLQQQLPVLFFSNEDIMLATSSPSVRRDYFDKLLSMLNPKYAIALSKYNKLLKNRNIELKNLKDPEKWNDDFAKYGTMIINGRTSFLSAISPSFKNIFLDFFPGTELIPSIKSLTFDHVISSNTKMTTEIFLKQLKKSQEKERQLKHTCVGPHRDDILFFLNRQLIKNYASQGQTRIFIYAMKLSVFHYISQALNKEPILLIDDVFADLDKRRIAIFSQYLTKCKQVFLACANSDITKFFKEKFNIFLIEEGKLKV